MGILNVTPDSFSDGGNFFDHDQALEHASLMVRDGADIIDVGGESTRPGAIAVGVDEEMRRAIPVIQELAKRHPGVFISIDTVKATVAEAAIEAGATIVNDVSAMRLDAAMPSLAGKCGCGVVLMHSRGNVQDMASYAHALYGDVTSEVIAELGSQILLAEEAGVDRASIAIDPGFGFSKRSEHSMTLLNDLHALASLDVPVMVGVSRKRFVTEAMLRRREVSGPVTAASLPILARDSGTIALNVVAMMNGARIFRVHDVAGNRRGLDAAWSSIQAARD